MDYYLSLNTLKAMHKMYPTGEKIGKDGDEKQVNDSTWPNLKKKQKTYFWISLLIKWIQIVIRDILPILSKENIKNMVH